MQLFQNASYRFIEQRKKAYIVSALVILVGLLAMGRNIVSLGSWQNYGVDFLGGSLVQVRFSQPVEVADLREALGGTEAPPITRFGGELDNEFVIRAPLVDDASITEVREALEVQLVAAFTADALDRKSTRLNSSHVRTSRMPSSA